MNRTFMLAYILLVYVSAQTPRFSEAASGGRWQLLQRSIGITAMHMQLLINDRVLIFDRTDFGPSNISLPNGKCRHDGRDIALKYDCTAHSVEYDVIHNTVRPLTVQTDVWCSSGSVMPNGTLVQTGGYNDGERRVRTFTPCFDGCDWAEIGDGLVNRRWYATNHILPDGRQIIIGGRRQFNYEFYPKTGSPNAHTLPFLAQTNDKGVENNLYPFVFLNVDGNLFIFANNRAILFDYAENKVVRTYPDIPGSEPRNYPSTGSSVLLPLKNLQSPSIEVEVLVCGGAPKGSYTRALKGTFVKALNSCGRMKISDPNPVWVMETMPQPRVMGDMTFLPNGDVLIVNGGSSGSAGWELGREPVLAPDLYKPDKPIGTRFETQNPSTIPRMYHSTSVLLRDGRVLIGGSNPHRLYNFTGVIFPTELSLEAFSPSYLDPEFSNARPNIILPKTPTTVKYNQTLKVRFSVPNGNLTASNNVRVTMVTPSFTTHSFSMNQRVLVLGNDGMTSLGGVTFEVSVTTPGSSKLAPPGYYLLFVVNDEVPSEGIWVNIL